MQQHNERKKNKVGYLEFPQLVPFICKLMERKISYKSDLKINGGIGGPPQ